MRYYDAFFPYIIGNDHDRSYPTPEEQLIWRLDDLHDVLDVLKQEGAPPNAYYHLSDDVIRYTISEAFIEPGNNYLRSLSAVERAIEIAKDDLVKKYNLPDPDTLVSDEHRQTSLICVEPLSMMGCPLKARLIAA